MALSRFFDVAFDQRGNALAGALVVVQKWDGSAVSIYQDRNGLQQYPDGLLTTDPYGNFGFYAPAGYYRVTISKAGYQTQTKDDVLLPLVEERFTAQYFGIQEGATGQDITAGLQAWAYALLEHVGPGVVPSGRLRSGLIELPDGEFVTDSIIWHPALSLYGSNRAGTRLKMRDNASPVGPDNLRAMFYILARTQEAQATGAWMPAFKHLRLSGNKGNQSNQPVIGIYCEKGENDPHYTDYLAGGTELKSYSAIHGENCEVEGFSGDGVRCNGDRQRLMLFGRFRSINHGLASGDAIVTEAAGLRVLGNDPVVESCGFGGCTGHSIVVSGCSGFLMRGTNVWGTTSAARSNNALAVHLQNVNGFSMIGNTINDTVSFFGAEGANDDRGFSFVGNHLKPNKAVFSADGVPVGTADVSCNAFIRVRGYKNAVIGLNDYSADSAGRRFEYLASFTQGAVGHIHFSASSATGIKPWHTDQAVPLYASGDAKVSMAMHDPYRDMHRMSGQLVIDMNPAVEPDPAYSFIHAGSLPALLGNRVHRERGDTWLPGKAQDFIQVSDGATVPIPSSRHRLNLYSGAGNQIPTMTLVLPATPDDGHQVEVMFKDGVRLLTLQMGDAVNHSLFGNPITRVPPGTLLRFTYKVDVAPAGKWWVVNNRNDGLNPESAAVITMTNGGNRNMDGANPTVHLVRGSTCTAFTVNLPADAIDGEVRRICVHQAVTAWTLAPAAGHTLHTTDTWPTTIPAGGYTLEVQFFGGVWYLVRAG